MDASQIPLPRVPPPPSAYLGASVTSEVIIVFAPARVKCILPHSWGSIFYSIFSYQLPQHLENRTLFDALSSFSLFYPLSW